VLPAYTPALNKGRGLDRETFIRNYFRQDFTNAEIAGFLALQHGITVSICTVKRILKRMRLKRGSRDNESRLEQIVSAILEELENSCDETLKTEV